jgi:hypothetical protein
MHACVGKRAARRVSRADGVTRYVTEVAGERIILPMRNANRNPII